MNVTRETLAEAWQDVISATRRTGGTQRERQAYGNGARDALDSLADILRLPLGEDPWDHWVAPENAGLPDPDEPVVESGSTS
jgi:hypothetical protein